MVVLGDFKVDSILTHLNNTNGLNKNQLKANFAFHTGKDFLIYNVNLEVATHKKFYSKL
jgi:hypothetical protein